jgi:hypothetical protein
MKRIIDQELKSINGGYYYTNEEVNSMKPEGSEVAESIGYVLGKAIAYIGVIWLTKRF